jgi:hypothetical protein
MALVSALFLLIRSLIVSRKALAAENLALRQQLTVIKMRPESYFIFLPARILFTTTS